MRSIYPRLLRLRGRAAQLRGGFNRFRERRPRVTTAVFVSIALVALLGVGGSVWFLASLRAGLPDGDAIQRIGEMAQATAVYDADDSLAFTIYEEQRIDVPLARMSPHVVRAILAIEDQRFYEHTGFDIVRIGAAALANVRRLRVAQGASTITQQLARQSFLTPDKTLRRKLQEVILAGRIEQLYTKDQILELYLNKVYFGDGLYGVEAASRGYFAKHASELSIAEAALLAGLVKSPSAYAPTVSRQRATARRNVVLQVMLDSGAIDQETWKAARAEPVRLKDGLRSDDPHGQYFKEEVRRQLVERFGWERVYQGGLRVFSTIDMEMQQAAEKAVADSLKALEERRRTLAARRKQPLPEDANTDPLQAALVAMDPDSGHVRAMIGGRDFGESTFNRAVQAKRQPGSAFKPFVYAAALEAGFTPASVIDKLNMPIPTLEGAWTPEDEHSDSDSMTLRAALRTSSNRAAVRLIQQVGIGRTVQYAKNMGVGDVPSVPSVALGSGEVTLQALTAAYAAFASQGRVPTPIVIRRVEDRDGRVLYAAEESSKRAISATTAYLMASMMADVINAGTGARARSLGFTLPAAGKTGTTNDFKDAWFVGFTPRLVAGVWVGFDQPRTIMRNGFAGDVVVPMWATFMKAATRGAKPQWLPPPGGLATANVCRITGKLASDGCTDVEVVNRAGDIERRSMVYTEYFVRGSQPTTTCELHQKHGFVGALASVFTGRPEKPAPPSVEAVGLPPAEATSGSVAPAAVPPLPPETTTEPPRRRRGFWSRVFGIGRDGDRKDEDKKDEKQSDDRRDEDDN
jgi:penicillin-binding protein 1A